ncbi:phenylacetate-CoA ligase [Halalkaliarchaeum desulfuricum]|uniref:Phenylacetate-CoA ligase n=1 Tax=Halalkaliarchaeum desulfuricum TaxID=2055893 RepID=A0A343TJY4_9EURY|nr:hypothetical protein [Halalkaliarchaeum desulfuricum]AUX09406.1 phenylacetate-CoA ligase [Halalkaliarchaeum desulfuricum]
MEHVQRIAATQLPNTLGDVPVMTKEEFARVARESDAPLRFATSKSGVPAPWAGIDHVARICADALRVAGVTDEAVHLNLGAPPPHSSGWSANLGFAELGATSLNRSFDYWERPIEEGVAETATVLSSIPGKAIDVAAEVEEAYGDPGDVFPNLSVGLLSGQLLRPATRRTIGEQWNLAETRELYGSSEASLVAAAPDESRKLVPLLNRHILEIEVGGDIVDVRDVETPTEGSLLITDPARSALTLRRYRQGDRVRVYPDDPLPRITPLGRADDAIDLDGALLHAADLFEAIGEVFPDASNTVVYVHDESPPTAVEVFIEGVADPRTDDLYEALLERQPALSHAVGEQPDDRIAVATVADIDDLPFLDDEGLKSRLIVFAAEQS